MQKITHFKAVPVMCGLTFMYDSSANQFKTILLAMSTNLINVQLGKPIEPRSIL